MLAPITHQIPPIGYGPWEQVVGNLTDGLIAAGHDVTLFACAGARTAANLKATVPFPLADWPNDDTLDHRIWEEIHVATVAEAVSESAFDIVHAHLNVHPLGFAGLLDTPMITTLHGAAWNRSIHPALARYAHLPFVSLSDSERSFYPELNYVATVNNGIDCDQFVFSDVPGEFLLFAGRMAPEKQPQVAVEVAHRSGLPLKLAGPIEDTHQGYFESEVAPLLDGQRVEYLGELRRADLIELYPKAAALLMPLAWDEPFGLVVVEALASGTPVIGWRRGALPELIRHGATGAIVDDVESAIGAIDDLPGIDRRECRRDAEARFSVDTMTRGYASAYRQVIDG